MVVGNAVIQALQLALAEKTGIAAPGPYSPTYSPPSQWSQPVLKNMAGTYLKSGVSGGYIKIAAVSGGLEWTEAGQKTSIVPRENGWLSAADSQATQYQFATVSGRNVIMWRLTHPTFGERTEVFAERYIPIDIPDSWKGRAGTWEAIDLDPADFQLHIAGGGNPRIVLSIKDAMLILDSTALTSGGSFIVQPVDDTSGYIGGLGRREGSAVKVLNVGGLEELQFLGVRYRKQ